MCVCVCVCVYTQFPLLLNTTSLFHLKIKKKYLYMLK